MDTVAKQKKKTPRRGIKKAVTRTEEYLERQSVSINELSNHVRLTNTCGRGQGLVGNSCLARKKNAHGKYVGLSPCTFTSV